LFSPEGALDFRELETAVEETRQIDRGNTATFRIGYVDMAFYSGVIPERIRRFQEENPGVRVKLIPATSAKQIELLDGGDIDLALLYQEPAAHFHFGNCRLCTEPLTVAVHQNNRLAHQPAIALSELMASPLFGSTACKIQFSSIMSSKCAAGLVSRRRIVQDAANDPTQLTLVAAQVGITFSPVSAGRTKPENVRLIRIREDPLKLTLYAAWRQNENTCPALHQLLRIVRQGAIQ
jgi:DNA-binding transcriptional LysR family regulator